MVKKAIDEKTAEYNAYNVLKAAYDVKRTAFEAE